MKNGKFISLKIKPLSVNEAWQGKRYKTPKYKAYEQELMLRLPPSIDIPKEGDLEIYFEFGIISTADYDNPIKPLQDILQKKYLFDDRRIIKATVIKRVIKKGEGYFKFGIISYTED